VKKLMGLNWTDGVLLARAAVVPSSTLAMLGD
jgi:hypothetical protein